MASSRQDSASFANAATEPERLDVAVNQTARARVVDAVVHGGVRTALRVMHMGARCWWWARRPLTHGALVAVWCGGRLLVLKNSYRRELTLPGGFVERGEAAVHAAARELREETGLEVPVTDLREAYSGLARYEQRDDHCTIFEVELETLPTLRIDRREVVAAWLFDPGDVLRRPVVPHLHSYLTNWLRNHQA